MSVGEMGNEQAYRVYQGSVGFCAAGMAFWMFNTVPAALAVDGLQGAAVMALVGFGSVAMLALFGFVALQVFCELDDADRREKPVTATESNAAGAKMGEEKDASGEKTAEEGKKGR